MKKIVDLNSKEALVTGANRGIGKAIVEELVQKGISKVYVCARNTKDLNPLLMQHGDKLIPLKLDVTNKKDIENIKFEVETVDILINNAGVTIFGKSLETDAEKTLLQNLNVNVFGILNLTNALLSKLKKNTNTAIINVLSIAGLGNMPVIGTYSISKAAAHSLTQGLRAELKDSNILVSGVYPGPIDTEMSKDFDAPKDKSENVATSIIEGLALGNEEIYPDFTSVETGKVYKNSPKEIEKEFSTYI